MRWSLFAAIILAPMMWVGIVAIDARITNAGEPYVVGFSPGGRVDQFIQQYDDVRRSGRPVVIDGMCISACTFVVGLIPHERICVTPFAQLAFHSAWFENTEGMAQHAAEGTRLAWQLYPESIRALLRKRGWDGENAKTNRHPELIYIGFDVLRTLFRNC